MIRSAVMHQACLETWALPGASTRQGQEVSYDVDTVNCRYGKVWGGESKCFSYSRVAR